MKTQTLSFVNLFILIALFISTGSLTNGQEQSKPKFKAIAFDAFPVFDPRPIVALAKEIYPEKGAELIGVWRTRQFEYQWLRALGGQYVDFMRATEDSLVFATKQLGLTLSDTDKGRLMSSYMSLSLWPDAKSAIETLHKAGVRLVFLSNMTEKMLEAGLKKNNLNREFEAILSTDSIQSYKPASKAYQLGIDKLNLPREEILFVAFAGWDVAGAKWFGYPTFWVNRLGSPMEELGVLPDGVGQDLNALVKYVLSDRETEAE